MQQFKVGQRWVSAGELHLGIGMVLEVEFRTVNIIFPATGETRVYAKQSAPLSRVEFSEGDTLSDQDGREMQVHSVEQQAGLLVYHCVDAQGERIRLTEGRLNNFLTLNQPLQRLVNGQIDKNRWFELRARTQKISNQLAHSDLQGLTGCRTSLIDHQLYIAHEVSRRFAPRVLLADEVGLGKTIEAGLIIHQQLLHELAQRVLIVVPESLQHQWLVEMMRRFNLLFSIFDEQRCSSIDGGATDDQLPSMENPFHSEQLILCSLEFLVKNPLRFEQVLEGEWDMLVVDEAHHLVWQPRDPSLEYQLVEKLSAITRSVLLLTATPEQLGKESHFARLRLLDPNRFTDLEQFIEEEKHYRPVADIVEALVHGQSLNTEQQHLLKQTVSEGDNAFQIEHQFDDNQNVADQAREQLVVHLLDRHGTGRILFRNTRHAVEGFPDRQLLSHRLPCPDIYKQLQQEADKAEVIEPQYLLSPELWLQHRSGNSGQWVTLDPRVTWLADYLKGHREDKVLIICSSASTVLSLVKQIKSLTGIALAAFHEGLDLVERDRAAAWFADRETGTQAMVCSEIGSEGRNFQFAHNLVMFDLPYNPDLLEQRIGRLDRIGQTRTINIHVPYLGGSAQQVMMEWIHQGLNAFEQTCPAAHNVFMQTHHQLLDCLLKPDQDHRVFYNHCASLHNELNEQMQQGRDRLLEYNSCRPVQARQLREQAQAVDQSLDLGHYMETLYDHFGINFDIHSPGVWVLQPTDNMLTGVPGLPDDGLMVTYDREVALANEDVRFLTWVHPLVRNLMDMVLNSEQGNTDLLAIKYPRISAGTLLLDCFFRIDISDKAGVQAQRYLPDNLLRICIDEKGGEHQQYLSADEIHRIMQLVDRETAIKVVKSRESMIKDLLQKAEQSALAVLPQQLMQAKQNAQELLQTEIDRLHALQTINLNVRDEEIDYFSGLLAQVTQQIADAHLRLDAIRVLVAI
jgi:ATP-dependent helicase HepA